MTLTLFLLRATNGFYTMSFVQPEENVNKWLRSVLLDMLDRYSDNTVQALQSAITILTYMVEPGMLEESFAQWIDCYEELLAEYQSSGSSQGQANSPVYLEETEEEPYESCTQDQPLDMVVDTK